MSSKDMIRLSFPSSSDSQPRLTKNHSDLFTCTTRNSSNSLTGKSNLVQQATQWIMKPIIVMVPDQVLKPVQEVLELKVLLIIQASFTPLPETPVWMDKCSSISIMVLPPPLLNHSLLRNNSTPNNSQSKLSSWQPLNNNNRDPTHNKLKLVNNLETGRTQQVQSRVPPNKPRTLLLMKKKEIRGDWMVSEAVLNSSQSTQWVVYQSMVKLVEVFKVSSMLVSLILVHPNTNNRNQVKMVTPKLVNIHWMLLLVVQVPKAIWWMWGSQLKLWLWLHS